MSVFRHNGDFTWKQVEVLKYKEEGTHFKAVTRHILFDGNKDLPGQLRYFEIAPGGHSTLERHEHIHVVMIMRGKGTALVGSDVAPVGLFDVIHIPPRTWHQFQSTKSESLGFLCFVNVDRDKPERPGKQDLDAIKSSEIVAQFIKI
jgi:mannose-6-phosphate isomerase-like protein (cupin superfamily)